jgi:hypothetical protein
MKSFSEAQENAEACIMFQARRTLGTGGESMHTTSKSAKVAKIRDATGANFIAGLLTISMGREIVKPNVMVEGVRPKLGRKTGASKQGAKCIFDGSMRTFARTGLM